MKRFNQRSKLFHVWWGCRMQGYNLAPYRLKGNEEHIRVCTLPSSADGILVSLKYLHTFLSIVWVQKLIWKTVDGLFRARKRWCFPKICRSTFRHLFHCLFLATLFPPTASRKIKNCVNCHSFFILNGPCICVDVIFFALNLLVPENCDCNLNIVIVKLISRIAIWSIFCKIYLINWTKFDRDLCRHMSSLSCLFLSSIF